MIRAEGVSVFIGKKEVVSDVTLTCKAGEMTALIGPSGCGKTTLLHALGLLLSVNKGAIFYKEHNYTKASTSQIKRFWQQEVAFILQDYGIMDEESVGFNVTMQKDLFGKKVKGDLARLRDVLEQTGLSNREQELASYLSGGEKQRLALARAIYKNAKVLYADEPTASLDAKNREKIIALFRDFANKGYTVIISTHDAALIEACDVCYEVQSNRIARK